MEKAGAVEFAEEVAEAVEEHGLEVSVFLGRADDVGCGGPGEDHFVRGGGGFGEGACGGWGGGDGGRGHSL